MSNSSSNNTNPTPGVKVTAPTTTTSSSSSNSNNNNNKNRDGSPSSLETLQPTVQYSSFDSTSNNTSEQQQQQQEQQNNSINQFDSSTYSPPSSTLPFSSSSPSENNGIGSTTTTIPTYRPGHRKRSSSIITVEKIETSHEEMLDQSAGFNANADWVNYKGAWVIHIVLILLGKILLDVVPGMEQDISWTLVNLGYIGLSYLMFHYVTGTPFDSNGGAYDELTLWEQIDEGAQYTPAKKWLTSVPIGVFLIATHYTKFSSPLFAANFAALLWVLFPKLPLLHRLRFKILPTEVSQPATPIRSISPTPGTQKRAY